MLLWWLEICEEFEATANEWEQEAEAAIEDGDEVTAAICKDRAQLLRACASRVQDGADEWFEKPLSVQEAAQESGYSQDALRKAILCGRIRNAGRKHSPRIRRADMPKKLS